MSSKHGISVIGAGDMSMYMGVGGTKSRYIAPEDFKGNKIRSMGPAENALLSALGSSPTAMAFGDVPTALQTGVIDGLLTSLGGFNAVKEQAPYFSVAGLNGIVGDYYWFGVSDRWWNSLSEDQRGAITQVFQEDFIPFQRAINFCTDQRLVKRFGTDDKAAPGIYVMTPEESAAIVLAEGGATNEWIKSKVDAQGAALVDQFTIEAAQLVKDNPIGSSALEQIDCSQFEEVFARYAPGGALSGAKSRK